MVHRRVVGFAGMGLWQGKLSWGPRVTFSWLQARRIKVAGGENGMRCV